MDNSPLLTSRKRSSPHALKRTHLKKSSSCDHIVVSDVSVSSPDLHFSPIHMTTEMNQNIDHTSLGLSSPAMVDNSTQHSSGREKLLQFRASMAGSVSIPETWYGESNLHEWVEWNSVDQGLRPNGLMMARDSLMNEKKKFQSKENPQLLQNCNRRSIKVFS